MIEIMKGSLPMLPPPFDQLHSDAIRKISLAAGERVFRQGDKAAFIYYLAAGEVRLVRYSEGGSIIPVFRAVAGDTFAEASLFSPEYHCDAEAALPSEVLSVSKQAVLKTMAKDPAFGHALACRFASQVQGYRRKLEILAIPGAEDRVFAALSDGWLIGKIADFADEIRLSNEATIRALSALVRKGRVSRPARGCYTVAQGRLPR